MFTISVCYLLFVLFDREVFDYYFDFALLGFIVQFGCFLVWFVVGSVVW